LFCRTGLRGCRGEFHFVFEGFLGDGAMLPIYAIGSDVRIMPNEPAMGSSAPGDWTVVSARDDSGAISQTA
jgi:hypothetical protein